MRWRAHFFSKMSKKKPEKTPSISAFCLRKHFGIKTFRERRFKTLRKHKFRNTKYHFEETLANDLKKINSSDKMFAFADKN